MAIEAPPRRHPLRTAVWVAVGVAAAALAWLALLVIVSVTHGYPIDGPFEPLGHWLAAALILGWLASIAGYVLARIARTRAASDREARRMRVARGLLAPGALLGTIAAVLVTLLFVGLTHPFADNPAADAGHRLSSELRANGGTELCSSSDPGLGPDNTQPWYEAYLELPMSSTDEGRVTAALTRAGFTPTAGSWGIGRRGTASATMDLLGATDVEIDCETFSTPWGHHEMAPSGDTIVDLHVELPQKQ